MARIGMLVTSLCRLFESPLLRVLALSLSRVKLHRSAFSFCRVQPANMYLSGQVARVCVRANPRNRDGGTGV